MDAILYGNPENNNDNDNDENFEGRMTHIAGLLVRKGINYCLNQYTLKLEQNSALNKATVKELNNAVEICDAIAFKVSFHNSTQLLKKRI